MRRGLAVVAFAPLFLFATAGPAAANRIESTYYYDDDTSVITDWCSFPIEFTSVGPYRQLDYFDNEDRLVKSTFTTDGGRYRFIISANGETLETTSMYKAWFFFDTEGNLVQYRETGEVMAFTSPGEGVVFLITGRSVLDTETGEETFAAGPHDEDFSKLCAALS